MNCRALLVGFWVMGALSLCAGERSAWAAPAPVWSAAVPLIRTDDIKADYYGQTSTISGDTIVVGADDATIGDNNAQGAAYVFGRVGASWVQQQVLTASDGAAQDAFANTVALSGNTLLAGAPSRDQGRGGAYVFVHTQTWVRQGPVLVAPDPGPFDQFGQGDWFGGAVAISGDTAVFGAPNRSINELWEGAAYVFVRKGEAWAAQGPSLQVPDGTGFARFGAAVAIDGDTLLIGDPHYSDDPGSPGLAYVFVRDGEQWTQQGPALTSGQTGGDAFGSAVSLSGDTALIGAPSGFDQEGGAYIFSRSGSTWTQQGATLRPLRGQQARVGNAVAVVGDRAIVAASNAGEQGTPRAGDLFVYTRSASGAWSQQGPGEPVVAASEDLAVGQSVAISGNDVVVGALGLAVGHGAAFALQVCTDPDACQFVDQGGTGGDSPTGGAGGGAGNSGAVGGTSGNGSNVGGSSIGGSNVAGSSIGGSNVAGSSIGGTNVGGTNVGGSNIGGTNIGGSNIAGSNVAVPILQASGVGGGPAVTDHDRAVAACGCRLAERPASSASAVAALALLALPCMLRRRLRKAVAKGQAKS